MSFFLYWMYTPQDFFFVTSLCVYMYLKIVILCAKCTINKLTEPLDKKIGDIIFVHVNIFFFQISVFWEIYIFSSLKKKTIKQFCFIKLMGFCNIFIHAVCTLWLKSVKKQISKKMKESWNTHNKKIMARRLIIEYIGFQGPKNEEYNVYDMCIIVFNVS